MPKNENEIILPASLETNAGVSYQVGDVISLPKGLRILKIGISCGKMILISTKMMRRL